MKKRCLPAAALMLLCARSAFATEFDPLIVTATRTAQTADETLSSVTVITKKEIERLQAQSVQDLLRGVPGVSIANNGGAGKATSVFLRGTESDHVLVLVDGVKVGSATLGTTSFQDIPVEQIERIEIVRGPRSSLYGSEAIGGVIQIFTRKGGGAFKPFFHIGGGSNRTHNVSTGVSGGGDRGWFNVSASGFATEGFDARTDSDPDRDGYRNRSGSLRAGRQFDSGIELDIHAMHAEGDNEFDGSAVNESESVQQVSGGTLRFSPVDMWRIALTAGRSRDESDNFKDGVFKSRFDTQRDTLSFQNDLSIATDHLLTLGADYQDDRVDGTAAYAVGARDNTGLFTQYQGAFGAQDVQLSLRREDNEQFGNRNTGGAAWGYALRAGLRLTAVYGTAFKAPTFNELYFPGYGKPDLRPEESRSMELGLRGEPAWGRWSLNAYETRIHDLIAFDSSTFAPANIDQARIRGLEAVTGVRLGSWDMNANLTLLDPENRSGGANDGNMLPRRARQSLRLDADRDFGHCRLGATLLAAGNRYDDLANTRSLGGYTTLDVRAEIGLAKDWLMQARIENLLGKDYETAAFYNQPGRSLYLTLRYQP
ncbi:MAG: TonB-dependent vitamin B12 receptor [Pseudomonadota bacterium]